MEYAFGLTNIGIRTCVVVLEIVIFSSLNVHFGQVTKLYVDIKEEGQRINP